MDKYIKIFPLISILYLLFAIPQYVIFNKLSKAKQKDYKYLKEKYNQNLLYALLFTIPFILYLAIQTLQNPLRFPLAFSFIFALLSIQLSFAMYRLKQYYFAYPIAEILFVLIAVFIYFYSTVGHIKPVRLERIKVVFAIISVLFIAVRGFETIEKKITPEMKNKKALKYWAFFTSTEVDKAYKIKDITAIISVLIAFIYFILLYK